MAKTYRNLWPQVVSWDNLLLAYRKCRRRKRCKPEVAAFDFAWESELLQLQRELSSGSYTPGPSRHFYIFDPKKRKISAAPFRDRVVHHAVVNVLEPLYEQRFVFDSYACRKGKGTHRALTRAQQFQRHHPYYLKTDIVKFFPSVDHAVLLDLLRSRIADPSLRELIERIVGAGAGVLDEEATPGYFPGDDLFAVLRPRGLPIGNLTSQFFANVLLDQVDHFIKEELRVPGYVRYCDDLVLFDTDKGRLREAHARLQARVAGLRLRLHRDKTQLRPSRASLKFLGFVLGHGRPRLQQSALRRFGKRWRRWRWLRARGQANAADLARSMQAWQAHLRIANAAGIEKALLRKLVNG